MKRFWRKRRFWAVACGVLILFGVWCVLFPPVWGFRLASAFVPGATYFVDTDEKTVALSIDDAPDAATTPALLETLKRQGVKATFFCIGSRIPGNEPLLRQMVQGGHEVGNHMAEDDASIRLSPADFERDMMLTDAKIRPFSVPHALRPGQGWYSREMIAAAAKHDYRVTLGSVWPYDTNQSSPAFSVWFIERNVRPGSIIVLHDSKEWGGRTNTVLNEIIPKLKRQGYVFVTVSELLKHRK